ncbi:MAG: right-handed parallel beta-helix repeat-containing protein [Solirubrobacterales bacterium]
MTGSRGFGGTVALAAALAALALPAAALAHLERPSYWPDPGPDTSVKPAAGGEVPTARTLGSAVTGKGAGHVRIVCQGRQGKRSLKALRKSLRKATKRGYRIRPSQERKKVSAKRARKLRRINRKLAAKCDYSSIQDAINDSGNNDRVVIMPGRYREPASRRAPTNDPRCADMTQLDSGGAATPSYRYQATCPNDQNLILVQGRKVGAPPPEPPLEDRHGIPDEGPCARCNMQIEGSGVRPEDVIIDGGKGYSGKGPTARPSGFAKHVILRADRADGFVGRNMLLRGALEFGFYTEETDGVLLDKVKFFWGADYGHLSFTTDHHEIRNCEAIGSGDAGVYPGAAPETGSQARKDFYPDAPRINTVVKRCDLHANVLAYSGSMGNAVRITDNHIYGNTAGISTDTISAGGHPGFPADSVEVDNNYIYSNNLDLYGVPDPPIEPIIGVLPSATGFFWAGHNDGKVHDNWIWDNWRYGTMLFAIPDVVVDALVGFEPEGGVNEGISCATEPQITTSCGNRYYDNHMGMAPPGFEAPKAVHAFGNNVGGISGVLPNGLDFWWDEFLSNNGNCWYANTGPDGTEASITGSGPGVPPDPLPADCATSMGMGDAAKELELTNCLAARENLAPTECDWFTLPPQPGTRASARHLDEAERGAGASARSPAGEHISGYFDDLADDLEDRGLVEPGELGP